MFKTLGKEPVKFHFNVALNSLDDLLLAGSPRETPASTAQDQRQERRKKKSGSGGRGVGLFKKKKKEKVAEEQQQQQVEEEEEQRWVSAADLGIEEGSQFVVHWSRGKKHSGKSEAKLLHEGSRKVVWMEDVVMKGTLFRDRKTGVYAKKLLSLQVEEIHPETRKGKIVGKADLDLGKIAPVNTSAQPEVTETVSVDIPCTLQSGKVAGAAKMKVNVNLVARSSDPGFSLHADNLRNPTRDPDFSLASTYTGVDTEKSVDDMESDRPDNDLDMDGSVDVNSALSPISGVTPRMSDASSLAKENAMMRNYIKTLKATSESKKSKKDALQKLQKEHEESVVRVKQLERELQNVKIELEHLQTSHTEKEKHLFEHQLKSQTDKTALAEFEEMLKKSDGDREELKQQLGEIQTDRAEWVRIERELKESNEELKRELNEALRAENNELQNAEELAGRIAKLEKQNAKLQEDNREEELQVEIGRLKRTLEDLRNAKSASDKERDEMLRTLQDIETPTSDGESTAALDISRLRTELTLLQEKYDLSKQHHADEVALLKQQSEKFELLRGGLDGNIERLKTEYRSQIKELEESKAVIEREADALQDKFDSLQLQLQSEQAENDSYTSRVELQISQLESEKTDLQDLMDERDALIASEKEKVQLMEARIEELEEKNDELMDEIRKASGKIDSIQQNAIDRVSQFEELRSQFEKSSQEVAHNYSRDVARYEAKLRDISQQELERFVLDNMVLQFLEPEYVEKIPISLKPIFLSLIHWRTFDGNGNTTFSSNILRALDYIVDKHVLNIRLQAYWLNFFYRLLNLLHDDFKEQVHDNLSLLTVTPEFETFTTGNDSIAKETNKKLKAKVKRTLPVWATVDGDVDDESNKPVINEPREAEERESTDVANDFIRGICDLLLNTYVNLLTGVFRKLEKRIDAAVFDPEDENANASITSPDGGSDMQLILSVLERYFKALNEEAQLEKRIIAHFFEHIAMFIDAYIFNSLMKDPQTNARHALQIKMSISFLVNWFEDNGVKVLSQEEEEKEEQLQEENNGSKGNRMQQLLFPLSRQSADVCVIGQRTLLTDKEMRAMVCPSLTFMQLAHLLSKYAPEEFEASYISQEVLDELEQLQSSNEHVCSLYVKPQIRLDKYRDPTSFKQKNQSLFDFSQGMHYGNSGIRNVSAPTSLTEGRFAAELSFLNHPQ